MVKINSEFKCCEHGPKKHHSLPNDPSRSICLFCNCELHHLGDGKNRAIPLTPGQFSMMA